jgi:hypothetical protein
MPSVRAVVALALLSAYLIHFDCDCGPLFSDHKHGFEEFRLFKGHNAGFHGVR